MNIEAELIARNEKSVEMEQAADQEPRRAEAQDFFGSFLSDQLIFRRAGGDVIGKSGGKGFLEGLKNGSAFEWRQPQQTAAKVLGDRAVVTLIVAGKRKDDQLVHLYHNIRFFTRAGNDWVLEYWYNYEVPTS